jgi:hypothetical protein
MAITEAVAEKHPLSMELGPERLVWKDDDIVDIVLTPIPRSVTTIYIPGPPGDAGYTSAGYSVTGTVNGSKVTGGYGGIDRMYVAHGLSAHTSKVAVLENYWIVWGSLMEDGSWRTGNVFLGEGDLATGTFNEPGLEPVIAVNEAVRSSVEWDSNGENRLPRSATLAFGGRTFQWTPTHNAAFNGPSGRFAHLYGTVQEVGGPKPVGSWSTMEIIKARAKPRNQV